MSKNKNKSNIKNINMDSNELLNRINNEKKLLK